MWPARDQYGIFLCFTLSSEMAPFVHGGWIWFSGLGESEFRLLAFRWADYKSNIVLHLWRWHCCWGVKMYQKEGWGVERRRGDDVLVCRPYSWKICFTMKALTQRTGEEMDSSGRRVSSWPGMRARHGFYFVPSFLVFAEPKDKKAYDECRWTSTAERFSERGNFEYVGIYRIKHISVRCRSLFWRYASGNRGFLSFNLTLAGSLPGRFERRRDRFCRSLFLFSFALLSAGIMLEEDFPL